MLRWDPWEQEFNTFSIVGRCARTGQLGVAIATKAMMVGSRCPYARAGCGAVTTQASTNPRLGPLALALLAQGFPAPKVLAELLEAEPFPEKRQIAVVDRDGRSAAHTGSGTRPWTGHRTAQDVSAQGNILAGEGVVTAMVETFAAQAEATLGERLLRALEAGKAAGGEVGGERSGALLVVDREPFPLVDIRVDLHERPIAELRHIWDQYAPLVSYFVDRATNPYLPREDEWLRQRGGESGRVH